MENIKIIRHLEEKKTEKMSRDEHIDENEILIVREGYVPEIISFIKKQGLKKMVIIGSNAIRSKETSVLLKDEVFQKINIPIDIKTDPRSNALYHGEYKKSVDPENYLIKKAKNIYLKEVFENKNPWYKYGDIFVDGIEKYPEMQEIFSKPGESQVDLNIRIYSLVLDLLEKVKYNNDTCFVLSTHYVVISRLLALQNISYTIPTLFHNFYLPNGNLYLNEWDATKKVLDGHDYHEFFKINNYIFEINLSDIEKIQNAIESDLDLYRAGYMQRYNKYITT